MNNHIDSLNNEFESIYKQLIEVYNKLSQQKIDVSTSLKGEGLWEGIFPGVLLMKNIELINEQMDEILDLTKNIRVERENHTYEKLEREVDKISKITETNSVKTSVITGKEDVPGELAKDIIKLRDQIYIAKFNCDNKQKKILLSLYEELGRILRMNGIESLEYEKVFNTLYHTIIEVRKTEKKELSNTIAEVCRPGYRINNKVIRAQEVVIYRYEERN